MRYDAKRVEQRRSRRERTAVGLKSGNAVNHPMRSQSTGPDTVGRKPEVTFCSAKSGRDVGESPTATQNADVSGGDQASTDRLIAFFRLLDEWERKRNEKKVM